MTTKSALRELKNAARDMQSLDYNTYIRPLKRVAETLGSDDLRMISDKLKSEVDFDDFVASADTGLNVKSLARLNWPTNRDQEFGLSIVLIERGAEDPYWFENFAYQYYSGGTTYFDCIRRVLRSVVIPFIRDFTIYVEETLPSKNKIQLKSINFQRVFIVHGHDEGPSAIVARFITDMGLEPVLLHEQADQGMTIIEKLESNSNVGYAIVILTPDDLGRSKSEKSLKSRARQNVILELGYFLSHLGREKVIALLKDEVEIPSDYMGVLYTPFDEGGAWRRKLAREMKTAGYDIDWNKVMV